MATTLEEAHVSLEIQTDLVRLLPNVHDLIAAWRAQIAAGQTSIGANCTAAARQLLGRLRRINDWRLAHQTEFANAIAPLGIAGAGLVTKAPSFRETLRVFRAAAKSTGPEITAALNALEASLPPPLRYLNAELPSDW